MSTRPATDPAGERDLLAVREPLRRVVAARVSDPEHAADVVQETLTRLWEARWRLDRQALVAYGIVVARNLITSEQRARGVAGRHAHRLTPAADGAGPEERGVELEEEAAVASALQQLSEGDRRLLLDHEVAGVGAGKLAAEHGTSSAAVGARLARARARLRVQHVLTMRRAVLPTSACRGVLEAISLGDRRRQGDLRAGAHLLECRTCVELSEPLLHRSRSLTAMLPIGWLVAAWDWVLRSVKAHPVASGGGAAVVAGGVGLTLALHQPAAPAPPPPAPTVAAVPSSAPEPTPVAGSLQVASARVLPAPRNPQLSAYIGRVATGTRLPVQSVPADEGFWVGTDAGARVWVQLRSRGESAVSVRAGDHVSFEGVVTRPDTDFAPRVGLTTAEGAAVLRAAGAYVAVREGSLRVEP